MSAPAKRIEHPRIELLAPPRPDIRLVHSLSEAELRALRAPTQHPGVCFRRDTGRKRRGSSARPRRRSSSELPETSAVLAADFDLRDDAHLTLNSSELALWVPRAGDLVGAGGLAQGTSTRRPTLASSVASMNGQRALLFDGVDDYLQWSGSASAWRLFHNNTGMTAISVRRFDSTGSSAQVLYATTNGNAATSGLYVGNNPTNVLARVCNGSGAFQNSAAVSTTGHFEKDVSAWHALRYGGGVLSSSVSGSTVSNPDAGGQVASTSDPAITLTVGRTTSDTVCFKGYLARLIIYRGVLSADELAEHASYLSGIYGVAA